MTIARKGFSGTAVPSSLNGAVGTGATTLVLNVVTGWPDGTSGKSPAKIDPGLPTEEDILYTTKAGSNLTGVSRAQNGTVAASHANGAVIIHGWSAGEADETYQHLSDTEADPHPTKLLNVARHDLTARHALGASVPAGSPVASAVTDTAADGVSGAGARADHRHAREGFGAPVASMPGDVGSNGVAATVARSDHKHPREAGGGGGGSAIAVQKDYLFNFETTAIGAFGNLATVGPTITITVGASGVLVVNIAVWIRSDTANQGGAMSFSLSGANVAAADFSKSIESVQPAANQNYFGLGATFILTGLIPGATTVQGKYATTGGGSVASFGNRHISAWTF